VFTFTILLAARAIVLGQETVKVNQQEIGSWFEPNWI
jgi:hypothetical protein